MNQDELIDHATDEIRYLVNNHYHLDKDTILDHLQDLLLQLEIPAK